jgi:uncharacterized membrane protein
MKSLAIFGRVLFAIPFGIIGLNHFFMTDIFLGMMTSFIPGGAYTILLTGALLILASISIMINKYLKITCFGLAALLFVFIVTIHIPGLFTPNSKLALVELLKDMALMGGAIMIAVHFDSPKTESTKE